MRSFESPGEIPQPSTDLLDTADKMIEKYLMQDNSFPPITDKMRLTEQTRSTISGVQDCDYPSKAAFTNIVSVNHIRPVNKVPLPPEILEQCGNIRTDFRMGLFPEISRAWLAIDSDIYLWNFETGSDVAYYDGLNETIVSVGLVKPKADVFQNFIQQLLILTTPSEILVIGVLLVKAVDNRYGDELQLTPDIIYSIPTESVAITKVFGTDKGRIFLGGADGCLYEIVYQKELGWWGKRCKKVNHSKGLLSFLVPSFVNSALYEEDSIVDMGLDKTRNILYTLTDKGTVEVFDLGHDGWGMYRVASLTQSAIMYAASNILRCENLEGSVEVGRIVSICPFEDHTSIGLVGVTLYGVRYYLSTCNSPRPTNLHLSHIRLPPGYTPISSQSMRGSTTLHAICLSGSFVVSTTTVEGTHDKLWCLSADMFATKSWFSENITEIGLSGKPVALAEISLQNLGESKSVPMLICQHNHVPDRIAVLTNQGTDIFEKLRPVDVLAEVLKRRSGPDSEQVKNLFTIVGHDDACAMCVMLACDHWTTNNQVAEWATRAFILYGGEAKPVSQPIHLSQLPVGAPLQYSQLQQPLIQPQSLYPHTTGHIPYPTPNNNLPSCFRPRDVSTPLGNKPISVVETQVVETSHKHNGLYIYLARILRNIWRKKIVNKVKMTDSNLYLVSSLFESDIARVTSHLYALKLFLQKNTQLPPANVVPGVDMAPPILGTPQAAPVGSPLSARTRLHEAQIQERNSLDSLKHLVEHSLQVLGLWKLLAEHQFHILVMSLPQELQNQMPELSFRELIFAGKDLCHALINNLINMYLNDNTSVDSISNKLREVCPSLFKLEDAACSKANEVLLAVKEEQDPEERQAKLRTALKLCKEVAGELDISSVCAQLIQCKYYEGVIELCVERANKLDPNSLAQHHLSKNHPQEDLQGAQAYLNRMKTYQEISVMLDQLYRQCHPSSKSPSQLPNGHASSQPHALLESVVIDSLDVSDEVCHSVVYDWLVSRGLTSSLVRLGRPSLERYLTRHPRKLHLPFRDLLWQYYETTGNHSAAAQILYNLAIQPCDGIKFDQRFNYLGKAVMCMRSDGCGQHMGIFLHELEDTLHVARVQRQIMDNLTSVSMRDNRIEEAIQKLNSGLLNITQLYENFAEPFDLWECQLTVLECAGYDEKDLIQSTWDKIISQELSRGSSSSPDDQMALVMNKVKSLGLQFSVPSPCFPLAYLVRQLEILSCKLNVNKAHVHSTMTSIGVPVPVLLEIYERLYTLNDRCWMVEGNEFHLIQVIASFADAFTSNIRIVPAEERKSVGLQFQDLIVNCLNTLYCKQDVTQLINYLKTIQTNLERV